MQSVKHFMTHLIDYAGLFPPAKLDMRASVQNYAAYRRGEQAWMLGRFIVPVARLDEFLAARVADGTARDDEESPWPLSAIARSADDPAALEADLDAIARCNDDQSDGDYAAARIETIELSASSAASIDAALDLMPDELYPYFELPLDADVRGMIAALAGLDAGAKVRTGGATADRFPSPAALASFIAACVSAGVPFKATAGLHHPFRHDSATVPGAKEFGFFNLLLGTVLLRNGEIDPSELETVLAEEDPAGFSFDDDRAAWRDRSVTLEDIEATRAECLHSYGSCSFEEPIDDLRGLHLI